MLNSLAAVDHVDMFAPGIGKVKFATVRDAELALRKFLFW